MRMTDFDYKKILIVNTFGIGDVLFTTPLIGNIKQQLPKVQLGYVANARAAQVLENDPLIDQVFVYERDEFCDVYKHSKTGFLNKAKSLLNDIKSRNYDLAIDLSMSTPTGLLMKLAGISQRVGFDYKGRGKFLTKRIPLIGYEGKHVVEFYFDLLRQLGFKTNPCEMKFPLSGEDCQWAQAFAQDHNLGQRAVVIVPGGGASWGKDAYRKQWAAEKFANLADQLVEKCRAKIVLAGSSGDYGLCQKISRLMSASSLDVSGQTTLGQSAALFQKSALVITNDGGPLHMAVSSGAKTLSIFGPVDEVVYGPYPSQGHGVAYSNIACRPCYRRFRVAQCDHISCLRDLDVETVCQKAGALLNIN